MSSQTSTAILQRLRKLIPWPKKLRTQMVVLVLITLILAVPIVGLPTINATEGLQIEPRWSVVVWMVLAVFLGRLVLNLWWHREQTSSSSTIPLNTPFRKVRLRSKVVERISKFHVPEVIEELQINF